MERFDNILYELPTIRIIGGASDQWLFNLRTPQGQLFDARNCTADCSIIPFGAKTEEKTASFDCHFVQGPTNELSALRINLASKKTKDLWGKFIYQITIWLHDKTRWGKIDIPMHGILYIGKNINPEFIESPKII